tara:strand:- start:257 stop:526 length:270 start_codon:yes stop_codon:yes gene_type:complete
VVDKYYSSADNVGWRIYGSTPLNGLDMGQAKTKMNKEERFELWVNKFRNELAEGQIQVLQDSLSNFEWPNEYKELIKDRIEELKPKQRR